MVLVLWLGLGALTLAWPRVALAQPLQSIVVTVTANHDGQLLDIAFRNGQRDVLRLAGIDVPACVRQEAIARTQELMAGRGTSLELTGQSRDDAGQLLGYLWIDAVMLNRLLVAEGYAAPAQGNWQYGESLRAAADGAQARGLGFWSRAC
jgi:endonuclease YncB( thermonuclease family)